MDIIFGDCQVKFVFSQFSCQFVQIVPISPRLAAEKKVLTSWTSVLFTQISSKLVDILVGLAFLTRLKQPVLLNECWVPYPLRLCDRVSCD